MKISKYETIGVENIRQLIHDFYLEIRKDKFLAPMYKGDFKAAEKRLHLFMIQYLGGPETYNEKRGHPQLRKRHKSFIINEEAKISWLNNMQTALDKSKIEKTHKDFLWQYFQQTAEFLRNS
jgi:hemoglobin